MLRIALLALPLLAFSSQAYGQVSPGRPPDAIPGPPYRPLPFDEDWRFVEEGETRSQDRSYRFKYQPLTPDGFVRGSFGAEFRATVNSFSDLDFGAAKAGDDNVFLGRVLLHGELLFGERARLFGTFQYAEEAGLDGPARSVNVDRGDIQNLFLDTYFTLPAAEATVRVGRQELSYGVARLIGTRDGPGVRQAFDGGKIILAGLQDWSVDAFYMKPTEDSIGSFDDDIGDDRELFGVYYTDKRLIPHSTFEAYYLGFTQDRAIFDEGTAESERHTLGFHISGATANWDWDAEAAYQFGSFGSGDISAWTAALEAGYTFKQAAWSPRIGIGGSIISGDDDNGDGDLETFEAPFPRGSYFDPAGLIGPRNLLHVQPQLTVKPHRNVSATLYSNHYWRFSTDDGLYNSGGRLVRSGADTDEREIGHSVALGVDWRPNQHWLLELEYIHFFTGDFISETGSSKDSDYFEFELTYRF
ncbi:MAG: alginate export family protein [Pseudomonadota bacterium]